MAKSDRFYFENFVSAADCCCEAARYLKDCLTGYDGAKIGDMLKTMHGLEHKADERKHAMTEALAKAFVTPLDREDLAQISYDIDDVADAIEEVMQRLYVNQITAIMPDAVEFAGKIVACCELMKDMLSELPNFKKPKKLHEMIIELNHMEEECDKLYLKASIDLLASTTDPLTILFWREIYEHMEMCADACEHVGDCVDTIVMKNT